MGKIINSRAMRFVVNAALSLAIMACITSCNANTPNEKQAVENSQIETPWQKSLSAFMKQPMFDGSLSLDSYAVVGSINDEEAKQKYLDKCFAEDSYFVVFNNEWENKRDLGLQSELADRNKFDASSFAFRKGYVKGSLTADIINIVELRWSYKGKNITTYAAVTNNEANPICYDNILTPYDPIVTKTVDTRSNGSGVTIVRSARPGVVKKKVTRIGIDGEEPEINVMVYQTEMHGDSVNMFQDNTLLWSIQMKNISRFNIADGILVDTSFEKTNYPFFGGGYWACDGGRATIKGSGIWGVSSSHSFEMGYGVSQGTNSYVTIVPYNMGLNIYANYKVIYSGIITDMHIW